MTIFPSMCGRLFRHVLLSQPWPSTASQLQPVASGSPLGTFVCARIVDGVVYDVFARHSDDGRLCFAGFDVYDPAGNWLTEGLDLQTLPSERTIARLVVRFKLARSVVVEPSDTGWRVVYVGAEVGLALAARWWPL